MRGGRVIYAWGCNLRRVKNRGVGSKGKGVAPEAVQV
jgi:hypothetical protein